MGGQVMSFENLDHCPGLLQSHQPHCLLRTVSCSGPEVRMNLHWSHYEVQSDCRSPPEQAQLTSPGMKEKTHIHFVKLFSATMWRRLIIINHQLKKKDNVYTLHRFLPGRTFMFNSWH